MARVKRGTMHNKRRRNLLKLTKGFMWGRKSKVKLATIAALKAGKHAYHDRRLKKRDMRALWQTRISAAVKATGTSYSKFIGATKKAQIGLDRKVMSQLAKDYPKVFEAVISAAK